MKKIFVLSFLLPSLLFAQKKDKSKKEDQPEIKASAVENNKKDNPELIKLKEYNENLISENKRYKDLLSQVNNQFLVNTFNNFYTETYFKEQGFKKLDEKDERIYKNANLIADVILAAEDPNSETYKRAKKSKIFKENIQTLDEVYNVLEQQYDEQKVNEAITKLEALKPFDSTSRIQIDKDEFINALKNYKEVSCNAKEVFRKTYVAVQKAGINLSTFKSKEFDTALAKKKSEESVVKFYETAKNKKFYPFLTKEIEKYKNNPTAFDDNSLIVDICTKEEIKVIKEEIVVEENSEETTTK